jgi:hypothetical protein
MARAKAMPRIRAGKARIPSSTRETTLSVMPPTSPMNDPTTNPISAPPATAPTPRTGDSRAP